MTDTVVLPSPGTEEATSTTCSLFSFIDFSILVRISLTASMKFLEVFSFSMEVNSLRLPCLTARSNGMLPMQRRLNTDLKSLVFLIVLRVSARNNASIRHTASAVKSPILMQEAYAIVFMGSVGS